LSIPDAQDVGLRAITRNPDCAKGCTMAAQGAEVAAADIDAIATNWIKADEASPISTIAC
jgi:hypothetical protein